MRRVARRAGLRLVACLVLGLVSLGPAARGAWADADDTPEALLTRWQAALAEQDHAAYLDCLHPAARTVPEYGSREAMRFWALEIEGLRGRGFAGRFVLEAASGGDPRLPEGAVRARPVLGSAPMDDAILLVREGGRWTILRLFS